MSEPGGDDSTSPSMSSTSGHWLREGCPGLFRSNHIRQWLMTACHWGNNTCPIQQNMIPRRCDFPASDGKSSPKFSHQPIYHYVTAKLFLALGGSSCALRWESFENTVYRLFINILTTGPACTLCSLCLVSLTVGNYCLLKTLHKATHVINNGCIISIISLCEGRKCSLLLLEDYSKSHCSSAETGRRAIITVLSYWIHLS